MPSMDNNNDTLSRIQRDIMEVTRREKELQAQYNNQNGTTHSSEDSGVVTNGNSSGQEVVSTNGTSELSTNGNVERASNWTPLLRAISTGSTLGAFSTQKSNGEANTRRFIAKGGNKGVMQKFLRAHGKLALVNTAISSAQPSSAKSPISPIIPQNTLSRSFSTTIYPELDTSQVTVDPTDPITKRKFVRNNYVPIEERMKREFQEMHSREKELNDDRRKSLTNLHTAVDYDDDDDNNSSHDSGEFNNNYNKRHQMNGFSNGGGGMTSARSLTQLYSNNGGNFDNEDSDGEEDHEEGGRRAESAQSGNLTRGKQMARSLADLCDVPDGEEFSTPGPRAMIMHFENMIRKNQLNRT